MNCYEWAAGVDIKCSVATDISYSYGNPAYYYVTIHSSSQSSNPKNKLASELTRRQLICKEISDPNIFIRQGIGCFERWRFNGNLEFTHTSNTWLKVEYGEGEPIKLYQGTFEIYLSVFRIIYRPDGSSVRVRVAPVFGSMEPWDTNDPFYKGAHRYWAKDDYDASLEGLLTFASYTDPDTGITYDPPITGLAFSSSIAQPGFPYERVPFKLGTSEFSLKAFSPYTNLLTEIGSATLDLSI